jgi:cytochrome c biogenesis protein CcmG/thiol:disulfide interchange protein DsbE
MIHLPAAPGVCGQIQATATVKVAVWVDPRLREDWAVSDAVVSRRSPWLRFLLFLVPALVFVGVLAAALLNDSGVPVPGDAAPDFDAPLLVGDDSLSLAQFEGSPVVLNFWASWCEPCEAEAPILKRLHERFGGSVAFLGVNAKDAKDDALVKYEEWDWGFASVRDENGSIYSDYGLTGQPETFIIDSEGVMVEHILGEIDEATLTLILEGLVTT